MRPKIIIAAKLIASFPLAWFGGNIIFGILAGGSWLPDVLHPVMQEWAFDILMDGLLWAFRIGTFFALLIGWVFAQPIKVRAKDPRPTQNKAK